MRFATSCFNKTIIRTDVKRFWPLLFLYTAVWTVMLPVYQWVELGYDYIDFPGDYLYNVLIGSLVMAIIFGCLFAMAVFSYMMNARSVGLMHSLPVSRGAQFNSHIVSVMGMLTAGKVGVAVLTVLVQAAHGDVAFRAIGMWLLVTTLVEFFFFALATLCCVVTGWLLAAPVLYGVANALAIAITELLRLLGELFYFGFAHASSYPAITGWLTPAHTFGEVLGGTRVYWDEGIPVNGPVPETYVDAVVDTVFVPKSLNPEAYRVLIVYTVVAVVMMVAAYFLYRRRASESAGDPVAFGWARPVFRYGVALCGGLALGLGLYSVVSVNRDTVSLPMLIVCFVLMGLLSYFAVEMVIRKSFRVFGKGWPGAAVVAVVLTLVCIGASMDITGYEHRLPDPDRIESVEINIYQEDVNLYGCTEAETIEALLALHKVIAAEGELPTGLDGYYNVYFDYEMTDGTIMRRRYTLSMPKVMENEAILSALDRVVNCEEVRYQSTLNGRNADPDLKLRGGYISGRIKDYNRQMTADEANRIYQAVLTDLGNGAGTQQVLSPDTIPECAVYIELESEDGYNGLWLDRIRPDFTETVKVLNEFGLDSATLFQVDPEYAEKYGW